LSLFVKNPQIHSLKRKTHVYILQEHRKDYKKIVAKQYKNFENSSATREIEKTLYFMQFYVQQNKAPSCESAFK